MDTHNIHTLQNDDTPLLCGGESGAYYCEKIKTGLIEMANKENWLFEPTAPMVNLIMYLENIIFITPANAGKYSKKDYNLTAAPFRAAFLVPIG